MVISKLLFNLLILIIGMFWGFIIGWYHGTIRMDKKIKNICNLMNKDYMKLLIKYEKIKKEQ